MSLPVGDLNLLEEDTDWELAKALDEDLAGTDNDDTGFQEEEEDGQPSAKRQRLGDPGPDVPPSQDDDLVSPLLVLPKEVQMRILSFLSAADLTTCAVLCNHLKSLSSEDLLWRRLFRSRWKAGQDEEGDKNWKMRYMNRDAEEARHVVEEAPEMLCDLYLQMQLAKRQQTLSRTAVDDQMRVGEPQVLRALTHWRKSRGFGDEVRPRPNVSHTDLHFHQIGDLFCCEETGWVHVCDEKCRECVVDQTTGLLVCPISGRLSDVMMTECEEQDRWGAVARGEDPLEDYGGRLANAYQAGYYCDDEKELQLICGAKLY